MVQIIYYTNIKNQIELHFKRNTMYKSLLFGLILITFCSASKYSKIVDNEGGASMASLYKSFAELIIDQFAGQVDSAEIAKIKNSLQTTIDSASIRDDLIEMVKETLTREEIKYQRSLYKTEPYQSLFEIMEDDKLDSLEQESVQKEIGQIYIQRVNNGSHPYFELLDKQQEFYTYNYASVISPVVDSLLTYFNTKQPEYLQLSEDKLNAIKSKLDKSLKITMNDVLWLSAFYYLDMHDKTILPELSKLQYLEQTIIIGNKLGHATIAVYQKRLSTFLSELE